ncbi:hypothetical protein [Streptomyces sp. NPDC005507]|uniref:hypothetical protein n=1 Tax=unclassified Streptomyces TaxID=2593676 RepID=UPI0033BE414B
MAEVVALLPRDDQVWLDAEQQGEVVAFRQQSAERVEHTIVQVRELLRQALLHALQRQLFIGALKAAEQELARPAPETELEGGLSVDREHPAPRPGPHLR